MLQIKNGRIYFNVIRIVEFAYILFLYIVSGNIDNALFANGMRVVLAICFIFIIIRWNEVRFRTFIILSGMFVIYASCSLIWAQYKQTEAMRQIFFNFLLAVLFLQCIRNREELEYIIKCVAISGMGVCVLIVNNNKDISALTSRITVRGFNINELGILLVFSALCCWYMYLINSKIVWFFPLCLYFFFSLLTGSKKVLVMIGIVVLFYAFALKGRTVKQIIIVFLLAVTLIVGIYAVFTVSFFNNIVGRRTVEFLLGFTGRGQYNASDLLRENMIKQAMKLFFKHYLFGIGVDNFGPTSGYNVYSHCNYTEILCNYGLVGFVLYYVRNIYYIVMYIRMDKKAKRDEINKLAVVIIIIYFLTDFLMVSYYSLFHQTILALVYGMLLYGTKRNNQNQKRN